MTRREDIGDSIFLNDEDPLLSSGSADASLTSSSFNSRASSVERDDDDMLVEVEQRKKEEWDAKLTKIASARARDNEEIASLKSQLSFANDLWGARVDEAVARTREEMSRGFAGQVSEVTKLLAEIDGKAKSDMLDLAEIDANLEFIELLQKPEPPVLEDKVKELYQRQILIYDALDVFADLVASVKRVLEIPRVSAAASLDVEVTDEGDEVGDRER